MKEKNTREIMINLMKELHKDKTTMEIMKYIEEMNNLKSIYDIKTIEEVEELLKHGEFARIFDEIFFVCDTDEKLEWLKENLISSINSAYEQHKIIRNLPRNS